MTHYVASRGVQLSIGNVQPRALQMVNPVGVEHAVEVESSNEATLCGLTLADLRSFPERGFDPTRTEACPDCSDSLAEDAGTDLFSTGCAYEHTVDPTAGRTASTE